MKITYELDLENFEAWVEAKEIIDRIIDYGIVKDVEKVLDSHYDNLSEEELNKLFSEDYEWVLEEVGVRAKKEIEDDIQNIQEELWDLDDELDAEEISSLEDRLSELDDELEFWKD